MKKNKKSNDWHQLSGKIPFSMTNDYLFRALMQEHKDSLKEFVAALLGWRVDEIRSATVDNPIVLGASISAKDFMLDVRVCLNNRYTVNLEMQVLNESNWPDRSLSYLCRQFDKLYKGQKYIEAKPVHQIGITNFSPFPDEKDFYATYMLLNTKTHRKYSDKFSLSVLNLTQVDNATKDDKKRDLDKWAMMYKCTTWDELKQLAADNPTIDKAVGYMYMMSEEEMIREQMEAREEYLIREEAMRAQTEKNKRDLRQTKGELKQAKGELKETKGELKEAKGELKQAKGELRQAKGELRKANTELDNKDREIAKMKIEIDNLKKLAGVNG